MSRFAVTLLAWLLLACARTPREAPRAAPANQEPQTRSTAGTTLPPEPAPLPAAHDPAAPGCVLSMQFGEALLDCRFEDCPPLLTASLLDETDLRLERAEDDSLALTAHRPTPPRVRQIAALTEEGGGWHLADGDCGQARPELVGLKLSGVAVRRVLPRPNTR